MGILSFLRRNITTDQKAVTLTDPGALTIFGVTPASSGITVTAANAMRVPAVACAVGLIADTVGTLPVKVFDRVTKETVKDHAASRLARVDANPWTSATELRTQITIDALLTGNGYALVTRNGLGQPLELHRLDPSSITPEVKDDGEPVFKLRTKHGESLLHYADVLHVQAFGGVSPIHLGREAIGLALAAEQHMAGFYRNAGRPSGIIRSPKVMDTEAKKKIAASWFGTHSGDKAGAILDEDLSYQAISGSNVDAEFMANRLEQVREIARVFRVPPTLLWELSRGTWSNTEEMGRQFLTLTLRPWLARWEAAYARCLLTPEERQDFYVEFVVDDLLAVGFATRATALGQYRSMGVMTANEARAALNLPAHPDGDKLGSPHITATTGSPAKEDPTA